MPNKLAHFAIAADDVGRARAFYELVFGWTFSAWGPPEFYQIDNAGVHGALQKRMAPSHNAVPVPGETASIGGFECSIAVDDLEKSKALVLSAGGKLIGQEHTIPTVGKLVQFADTEGNLSIIIQYEAERLLELGI